MKTTRFFREAVLLMSLLFVAMVPLGTHDLSAQESKKSKVLEKIQKEGVPQTKKGTEQTKIDPAKHLVGDATLAMKGKNLKDGVNAIQTAPSGLKLSAVVKGGAVTGWIVTDSAGNKLPTTHHQTMAAGTKTCWECAKDVNGDTHCWKIPCPIRGDVAPTTGTVKAQQ